MTFIADAALRSSIVVLFALAASVGLRQRSAAVRHLILAAGIFAAATVAPLSVVLPAWNISLPAATSARPAQPLVIPEAAAAPMAPDAGPAGPRASAIVMVILALGCAIGLALLIIGIARLARMTASAERVIDERWLRCCERLSAAYGLHAPTALLRTRTSHVIATWGLSRPCVLLPFDAERWDEPRIGVVLAHELAHVRRRDWLVQIASDIVRALFWFNPLFWVACRRLRRESEQACDDAVLASGVPPAQYAAQLVEIARTCRQSLPTWTLALPIARPSSLERRIAAMLSTTRDRRTPTRRTLVTTVAGLLGLAVAVSAAGTSSQVAPLPLVGHVYDVTGGVLPQVALTLNVDQSAVWQATTDSSGRFEFPSIGSGRYVLSASLAGFRSLRHELVLNEASDWERAITLQVGTVQETIVVTHRRRSGVAPGSLAISGMPLRVGGNIRPPRKTVDVKPVYPESMRDAGLEGLVPIDAVIGTDGTVVSVRVVSAQVHPDFAIAAIDAVRQWRFTPTLLNGSPVEVVMTVTVQFSLSD